MKRYMPLVCVIVFIVALLGFSNYIWHEQQRQQEEQASYEIIKHKTFKMRPMSVDEAILQMNMLGHAFFMFCNGATGAVNVVYRRDDGNYAVLEPSIE